MIRPGKQTDIESILRIDPLSSDPDRQRLVREAIVTCECFIYEAQEEVVGYGILHHHFFGRSFIELVVVAEKFQRRGIASSLIRHLEGCSRTVTVFTSTNQSNVRMQNLLVKLGYNRSGMIENLDPGDPELVYSRSLG